MLQHAAHGHECATLRHLCTRLAQTLGLAFVGEWRPEHRGRAYIVPSETLDMAQAATLGVGSVDDLFGGIVPQAFVGTKVITHALVDGARSAPLGWNAAFTALVQGAVLQGCAVFHRDDLRRAALSMLGEGPLRAKRASGIGGLGQRVIADVRDLDTLLGCDWTDALTLAREGLVLEQNLTQVTTLSVGQVQLGTLRMSYLGTQRCTRDNRGQEVYGGSQLSCVRGDFDALDRLAADDQARCVVGQATRYHRAALQCFPGLVVSRANYDVAHGADAQGKWRSGVLEQSWRVGGASHAEIEAAAFLLQHPVADTVTARTVESYGQGLQPPADALVSFHGNDPRNGPMLKYAQVLPDGDA